MIKRLDCTVCDSTNPHKLWYDSLVEGYLAKCYGCQTTFYLGEEVSKRLAKLENKTNDNQRNDPNR